MNILMSKLNEERSPLFINRAAGGSPSGSRGPTGAGDEREASREVQEMFGRIAPRYDLLNHLLSFSLDKVWRRRTANRLAAILEQSDARVLDLCCGTGDLTLALQRRARRGMRGAGARVYGTDFSLPMLALAREKARGQVGPRGGRDEAAPFLGGDALTLPFGDGTFDLVTAAFGFRNLSNYRKGLAEIARVLRPGGTVAILEFSEPRQGIASGAFRFYFRHILPRVGGAISGNAQAYSYLPGSVEKFPAPEVLKEWMGEAGFEKVEFTRWNFGSVALHTGVKALAA
jgi:demethylmenaquinone methyltransferase / 2-methoxy-6-polyprenyl-1,4-benzoquinol methylase